MSMVVVFLLGFIALYAMYRSELAPMLLFLIVFALLSTEGFYRAIFIGAERPNMNAGCAALVSKNNDVIAIAVLGVYAKNRGINDVFIYSTKKDKVDLEKRFDEFFFGNFKARYIDQSELKTLDAKECVFIYTPDSYCLVSALPNRTTLLPRGVHQWIPSAQYLEINLAVIENCIGRLF